MVIALAASAFDEGPLLIQGAGGAVGLAHLEKNVAGAGRARLAIRKILAGETVAPEELDANYIRRSDAEIFAKP